MSAEKVYIFDTSLRDGEQVPGCKLRKEQKVAIAEQLDLFGVDIIEAGFPISSPGVFDAVSQVAAVVQNATVCALSRAVMKDNRPSQGRAYHIAARARHRACADGARSLPQRG